MLLSKWNAIRKIESIDFYDYAKQQLCALLYRLCDIAISAFCPALSFPFNDFRGIWTKRMMAKKQFIILFIGLESVELFFSLNLWFYFFPIIISDYYWSHSFMAFCKALEYDRLFSWLISILSTNWSFHSVWSLLCSQNQWCTKLSLMNDWII